MKVHRSSHVRTAALPGLKSRRLSTLRRALSASVVVAGLLLTGLAVPAEAATVYKAPLRTAVRGLVVAAEVNTGYDRDRYFGVWRDTNGDCQNTRQEVLIQESKAAVSFTSRGCTASTGRWVTSWDNRVHTSASTVQIDHTVPVHEAWGSGARHWSQARRVAYYNDLGDTRTLSAQTSALNSSKQASGPEAWMPPQNRCAYIGQWVAVKIRWGLRVDSTEKAALIRYADSCPNITLTVTRA
ncbi:HNH endonuclease family protein [Arthrobacter sp. I3]|uniref:HNH endonuclease family protein n=1 Tax=Arthrobacter sp. I3 TaxID=218158 RepID=UPI0012EBE997|nr:HNH endonuclease family protein [Arthrobacter sp. I3]